MAILVPKIYAERDHGFCRKKKRWQVTGLCCLLAPFVILLIFFDVVDLAAGNRANFVTSRTLARAPGHPARNRPLFVTQRPAATPTAPRTAQSFHRVVRTVFPKLNHWLNGLPDPRLQAMCFYSGAHFWWQILATYLSLKGSSNGFGEQRQSGEAAWNLG